MDEKDWSLSWYWSLSWIQSLAHGIAWHVAGPLSLVFSVLGGEGTCIGR